MHEDDRANIFNNMQDSIFGCDVICDIMQKYCLNVHAGRGGKNSKSYPFTKTSKIEDAHRQLIELNQKEVIIK